MGERKPPVVVLVAPFSKEVPMSRRIPRLLDPVELRVLGSLLEKEQTTPDAYPLSLNALLLACNQKTNREPPMQLGEAELIAAIERLRQDVLVWRTDGARVERYKQSVDRRWDLDPAAKALLTLLLLRGPQTTGQLRERTERMHPFASSEELEQHLDRLAAHEEPLVRQLPRRLGQKETRWTHLLGDTPPEAAAPDYEAGATPPVRPSTTSTSELLARIAALERRVAALEEALTPKEM
jgi:uncharacterized protein YceH (UPF0502 family)